jgi:hypothetical protein
MTFAAWVHLHETKAMHVIASQFYYRSSPTEFFFHFSVSGPESPFPADAPRLVLRLSADGRTEQVVKDAAIDRCWLHESDAWTHVAFTIQAQGPVKMYQNGVEVDTRRVEYPARAFPEIGQPLMIGGNPGGRTSFLSGSVDEVAVFDRVLEPAQIKRMVRRARCTLSKWPDSH